MLKANQEPRLKDTFKEIIESKLEDFLLSSYAQNFYSRMFGKFDYRKFHFIGVVEKYEESLNIFNQLFGTSLSSHHVNKTKSMGNRISNQVTLSEDFKIKFKIFDKFNYDFYNYALSSLNK